MGAEGEGWRRRIRSAAGCCANEEGELGLQGGEARVAERQPALTSGWIRESKGRPGSRGGDLRFFDKARITWRALNLLR